MRAEDFILTRLLCWFETLRQENLRNGKERVTRAPDRAHPAPKGGGARQQRTALRVDGCPVARRYSLHGDLNNLENP